MFTIILKIIFFWWTCWIFAYMFVAAATERIFDPNPVSKRTRKILRIVLTTLILIFAIWATNGDILKPLSTNL